MAYSRTGTAVRLYNRAVEILNRAGRGAHFIHSEKCTELKLKLLPFITRTCNEIVGGAVEFVRPAWAAAHHTPYY